MAALKTLSGAAAPLLMDEMDAQLLAPRTEAEKGGGKTQGGAETVIQENLFTTLRFDANGREVPDFVLNRPEFREAKFLIAGTNVGCGSAREHAVWALTAFGIRCVIAPSYGPLFHSYCFKNGVLPITLDAAEVARLAGEAAPGAPKAIFSVDVAAQTLVAPSGRSVAFSIPTFRLQQLLEGIDELDMTLKLQPEIAAFHAKAAQRKPWLYSQ
jgi:3-isopropylmalate/(R)-2-methylmalate dehydratase small subunit